MPNLLCITIGLPLAGAAAVMLIAQNGAAVVRRAALLIALVTLVLAGVLAFRFPGGDTAWAESSWSWLSQPNLDVKFSLGLDGLSVWLFGLSALLTITAILVSWTAINEGAPAFYALLLLLETGMLGVFAARDILLFYIFFEFTLIPLFFLIGVWGSDERRYAAIKFFLFTLAGSVLTFLGLLGIVLWVRAATPEHITTFSIPELTAALAQHPIHHALAIGGWQIDLQMLLFVALFAGLAIKVPLFPLHTWLPLAHVQAPTAGSVILAGVLLKIGAYGFLRFSLPMLPEATAAAMPWMLWLSAAGIVYGALVALAQSDMKRLIAYSSVSHLGYCMLGLFALNKLGTQGGVLQLLNHGLSTGGLFAIVGMVYERYHTRKISDLGGLAARTPRLAACMVLFTLSSIGLPGLNGFAGEFLVLIGMFQRAWHDAPPAWQFSFQIITLLAMSGIVLGAWYMLWLVQRVFFGPLREPEAHHEQSSEKPTGHPRIADLRWHEAAALAPLVVFIFWIGLQPEFFRARMSGAIDSHTAAAARAVDERAALPLLGDETEQSRSNVSLGIASHAGD